MSAPSATRLISPPLSEQMGLFSYSFSLNSCKIRSILCSIFQPSFASINFKSLSCSFKISLFSGSFASRAPLFSYSLIASNISFSSLFSASLTLKVALKFGFCASISTLIKLCTMRLPLSAATSPEMIFISVLLPLPFLPMIAIFSFSFTLRLTLFKISFAPNFLLTSIRSINAIFLSNFKFFGLYQKGAKT